MPTYTVFSRSTSPLTGATMAALSHEAAVSAAIAVVAGVSGAGATGTEYYVPSCVLLSASGPTGTYSAQMQYTGPLTGSTYSGTNPDDAKNQHKAALGPTGPGGNLMIRQTY